MTSIEGREGSERASFDAAVEKIRLSDPALTRCACVVSAARFAFALSARVC